MRAIYQRAGADAPEDPEEVEVATFVVRVTTVEAVIVRAGRFETVALRDLRAVESDPTIIRQPASPLGAATPARKVKGRA